MAREYTYRTDLPEIFFVEYESTIKPWLERAMDFSWRKEHIRIALPRSSYDSAAWTGRPTQASPNHIQLDLILDYNPATQTLTIWIKSPHVHEIHLWADRRKGELLARGTPFKSQSGNIGDLYGLYRRPTASLHGSATVQPRSWGGGAQAGAAHAYYAGAYSFPRQSGKGRVAYLMDELRDAEKAGDTALCQHLYLRIKAEYQRSAMYGQPPLDDYPAPVVPHEGIKPGEVHAWRLWRFSTAKPNLHSVSLDTIMWPQSGIMKGDVTHKGEHGVHAFKCIAGAVFYYDQMRNHFDSNRMSYSAPGAISKSIGSGLTDCVVIGRVALWGEIVEHEHGYRAEFARVVELQSVIGAKPGAFDAWLTGARKYYKLGTQS